MCFLLYFGWSFSVKALPEPTHKPHVSISKIAKDSIALSREFTHKQTLFLTGKMTSTEVEEFLLQKFFSQNNKIIKEIDLVYIALPQTQREALLRMRKNLVTHDSKARELIATLRKEIAANFLPSEIQHFIAVLSSVVTRFQKNDADFRKNLISREVYLAQILTSLWPELIQMKIHLAKQIESKNNPTAINPSHALEICDHLLRAMQSSLRFAETKNSEELSLQADSMGKAGTLLAEISRKLRDQLNVKSPLAQIGHSNR